MRVIKSSGEYEPFKHVKIYKTVREAGGSKQIAKASVAAVKKECKHCTTTSEILSIILKVLKQEPGVAERYNLKQAIMNLGPTGFPFERYFSKVLEYYGYQTTVGTSLKGKKVIHEIDIIAIKKKKSMIECKYHNKHGIITRLKEAMYTHARFLDLAKQKFDEAWLVTNTKCSNDARQYAKGVSLKITGWNYPKGASLQDLIEKKGLYPITVLHNITETTKQKFFEHNIFTLKDFENLPHEQLAKTIGISEKKAQEFIRHAHQILGK